MTGPAGTGKSYTMGAFLACLGLMAGRGQILQRTILAAPTHRAVKVAREKLAHSGLDQFKSYTCARLTGMRAKMCHKTGKEFFVPEGKDAVEPQTELLVIDEVSMVNEEMHGILRELVARHKIKCLLVGDECQLPPVKERLNPFFSDPKIPRFRLTEVLRHDGPILEAATKVRLAKRGCPVLETVGDGKEFFVTNDRPKFHRMFTEAFVAVDHAKPDHVQALCWTNARVDELNTRARRQLYGDNPATVVKGELLYSTKPVYEGGTNMADDYVCGNSTFLKVVDVQPSELDTGIYLEVMDEEGLGWVHWPTIRLLDVSAYSIDTDSMVGFTVIHQDDRKQFDGLVENLKKWILAKHPDDRRDYWRDNFYPFKNFSAPVKSACAMTTHKAQGTTLQTAFIDLGNMRPSGRAESAQVLNRMAYTALTRAAKRVVIFDPYAERQ